MLLGLGIYVVAVYVLILGHELGHFTASRLLKVRISKFGIGAIKVLSFKYIGTTFEFGILPVVGYVEQNSKDVKNLQLYKKLIIILAGPFASAIMGFIFLVFSGVGIEVAAVTSAQLPIAIPFMIMAKPSILLLTKDMNNISATMHLANLLVSSPAQTLGLIGIISLGVAGINLFPIPLLDGGQALFEILKGPLGKYKVKLWEIGNEISILSMVRTTLIVIFFLYLIYTLVAEIYFRLVQT